METTPGSSSSLSGAAAAGSAVSYADLQRAYGRIPTMTVVELKGVIRDIGSVCRTKLAVSGTKPSLVNRITDQIKSWAKSSSWNNVRSALRLIDAPRDNKGNLLASNGPLSASGGAQQNTWDSGGTQRQVGDASAYNGAHNGFYQTNYSHGNGASRSSEGGVRVGYHKLKNNSASVRMGNSGYVGQSSPHAGSRFATGTPSATRLVFRPSPFWQIERFLTAPIILQEAGPQIRKSATIDLKLESSTISLLKATDATHQVRLFCTLKAAADVAGTNPSPVEFPMSCEARINDSPYSASLKGSKKTPGRVPPPNLNKDKTLITREGMVNKIELVYANAPQKYVMAIALCRTTSVDSIVDRLKREKRRTKEDIIGSMRRAAAEDDIEIGSSTLSLRDPLSYTRIRNPCRSIHCWHSQCFDASFFFMSNEQAPTWQCPHCSKILAPEDLFIDGYFDDILQRVPESEDAVEVDADGAWRTKDGSITSSDTSNSKQDGSVQIKKSSQPAIDEIVTKQESDLALPDVPAKANGAPRPDLEVVALDDDDTPPPEACSRPIQTAQMTDDSQRRSGSALNVSAAPTQVSADHMCLQPVDPVSRASQGSRSGASAIEAIDLTLSDSEDDLPPRLTHAVAAPSLTEHSSFTSLSQGPGASIATTAAPIPAAHGFPRSTAHSYNNGGTTERLGPPTHLSTAPLHDTRRATERAQVPADPRSRNQSDRVTVGPNSHDSSALTPYEDHRVPQTRDGASSNRENSLSSLGHAAQIGGRSTEWNRPASLIPSTLPPTMFGDRFREFLTTSSPARATGPIYPAGHTDRDTPSFAESETTAFNRSSVEALPSPASAPYVGGGHSASFGSDRPQHNGEGTSNETVGAIEKEPNVYHGRFDEGPPFKKRRREDSESTPLVNQTESNSSQCTSPVSQERQNVSQGRATPTETMSTLPSVSTTPPPMLMTDHETTQEYPRPATVANERGTVSARSPEDEHSRSPIGSVGDPSDEEDEPIRGPGRGATRAIEQAPLLSDEFDELDDHAFFQEVDVG